MRQVSVKFDQPVAIDKAAAADILVLEAWGTVHRLRQTGNAIAEVGSFHLPGSPQMVDMTYSSSGGQESILITGNQSERSIIWRYDLDGHKLQTWVSQNVLAGIDFNTADHSAYLATSDSNDIDRLDLNTQQISFVTRIHEARRLGPLAVDSNNKIIYVADVVGGVIYQYSILSKSSKILVSQLSAPTALYFDPQSGRLYVADAGRQRIVSVDTYAKTPVASNFTSSPLRSPSGVALVSGGAVAVTDLEANCIYLFSSQGALISRIPN